MRWAANKWSLGIKAVGASVRFQLLWLDSRCRATLATAMAGTLFRSI
jgi:hypothetical protein